jgi:hypothetical protein
MHDFPWSAKEMTAVHFLYMQKCEEAIGHRSGAGGTRSRHIQGNAALYDTLERKIQAKG